MNYLPCSRAARATLLAGAAALTMLLTGAVAQAQTVVFDNGAPDGLNAFFSDIARPEFAADTFTFGSTTLVESVQWFGGYSPTNTPPLTDNFTIRFYNTTGGTPDVNPFATFTVGDAVNRTPTGGTIDSFTGTPVTAYRYTATLPGSFTFVGGTTYGIEIFNNTTGDFDDDWGWATSNQTGTNFFRVDPSGPFFDENSGDLSFRLISNSVIPEPPALALLAPVLPFAVAAVRRHRKAA